MELYQLRYFLEVARQRNITKAAATLRIAQTALSEQLRKLEADLGAQLVVRGRRESTLTAAGKTLATHAAALLTQADTVRDAVAAIADLRGGQLALASIPSVSACMLPPLIAEFRKAHPGVEIVVMEDTSTGVAEIVESGRAELGIVQMPVSNRGLEVRPFLTEPFALLVATSHPLSAGRSVRLRALSDESFVLFKGRAKESALSACRTAGFEPRLSCESGELETVRAFVASGLGVAILPALAARLTHPGTKSIALTGTKLERKLAMVSRRNTPLSPSAGKFLESLLRR